DRAAARARDPPERLAPGARRPGGPACAGRRGPDGVRGAGARGQRSAPLAPADGRGDAGSDREVEGGDRLDPRAGLSGAGAPAAAGGGRGRAAPVSVDPVAAAQRAKAIARAAGFDLAGVASADAPPELRFFPEWIARGH